MDNLFPLFFALYILGSIISAVLKKREGDQKRGPVTGRPTGRPPMPRPYPGPHSGPHPRQHPTPDVPSLDEEVPQLEPSASNLPLPAQVLQTDSDADEVDAVSKESRELDSVRPFEGRGRKKRLMAHDLRRAIVLTEILGAPRAVRPYRPPGLGTSVPTKWASK